MAPVRLATVLRHIHHLAGTPPERDLPDAQLLQRFLAGRDEAAFRALVDRHGRTVLGVCRSVLRHEQDAEDAFQATFLILARNAASIRRGAALASWLYGVAYRVASNSRRQTQRRQQRERRARTMARAEPHLDTALRELQEVVTQEVQRLPEKYRGPFVLCCLEGKSKSEAAAQLGWKEGTVSGRLAEARQRLRQRLARQGVALSAALCVSALGVGNALAVPPPLAEMTVRGALGDAAPARIATLVEGATRAMSLSKAKLATLLVLAAGLLGAAAGRNYLAGFAAPPPDPAPPAAAVLANAPPEAALQVTVRGRVLDPDGKPLAGAEVLLAPPTWGATEKAERVARATTGTDGRFRFTADPSAFPKFTALVAAAPGYGPDWTDATATTKGEVTLRLVKDVPVVGRVLTLEGQPAPGATVRVLRLEAPADGDLTPVIQEWNPDGNRVSGRLGKQLYRPAWVGIASPVTADTDGRFRLTGLGGERVAVLRVEGPTIAHQVLYVLTRPGLDVRRMTRPDPDKMRPGMGRSTAPAVYGPTFEHTAKPTRPVVGVVRDRLTGKPVAGAHVNGQGANQWWEDYVSTVTDAEGRYRLVGMPKGPSYRVTAAAVPQDYAPAEKSVTDREGVTSLTLDFELVRGIRVRGRVTDRTTGKPVRAALWYTPLADNKYFGKLPGNGFYKHGIMGLTTDRDGTFSLLALPGSGLLTFRAEVEGDNPYTMPVLEPAHRKRAYSTDPKDGLGHSFVAAGGRIESLLGYNAYRLIEPEPGSAELSVDVPFDRGKTQTCKVVGPDGAPVIGARVAGLLAFGGVATLRGDTFTALALNPAQPRTVAVFHAGRRLAGSVVLRGDEAGPVTVRLRPCAKLKGRLLDEDGRPLVGAEVRVSYGEYAQSWLAGPEPKTDATGAFAVEAVFPDVEFTLVFVKGGKFRDVGERYQKLSLPPSARKDLGDLPSKVYGME
jgi:RNA polymerase sigma factor (sigma-70 family)